MGDAPPKLYEPFSTPSAGRGLRATCALKPGTEVLRERPAACAWSCGDDMAECIDMLAQIIIAGATEQHREPLRALLSEETRLREKDASLLEEVGKHATPAVQRAILTSDREGAEQVTPSDMSAESVVTAYCKHLINSMGVLDSQTFARRGMALYPHAAALLNHSNAPNCWANFEPDGELRLRTLCAVAPAEELTIAYLDTAVTLSELRAELLDKYLFDCGGEERRFAPATVDSAKVIGLAAKYRSPPPPEPAALVPVVTAAMDAAVEAEEWAAACDACDDLLFCYRFCYRVIHPRVGLRLVSQGLSALNKPGKDLPAAKVALAKATKILTVTHGAEHPATASAAQTLDLVTRLLAPKTSFQGYGVSPP